MLKTKSCPRCKKGDLAVDRDHHGWYEYCLQCGYVCDLVNLTESEQKQGCGGKKRPTDPDQGDSGSACR